MIRAIPVAKHGLKASFLTQATSSDHVCYVGRKAVPPRDQKEAMREGQMETVRAYLKSALDRLDRLREDGKPEAVKVSSHVAVALSAAGCSPQQGDLDGFWELERQLWPAPVEAASDTHGGDPAADKSSASSPDT